MYHLFLCKLTSISMLQKAVKVHGKKYMEETPILLDPMGEFGIMKVIRQQGPDSIQVSDICHLPTPRAVTPTLPVEEEKEAGPSLLPSPDPPMPQSSLMVSVGSQAITLSKHKKIQTLRESRTFCIQTDKDGHIQRGITTADCGMDKDRIQAKHYDRDWSRTLQCLVDKDCLLALFSLCHSVAKDSVRKPSAEEVGSLLSRSASIATSVNSPRTTIRFPVICSSITQLWLADQLKSARAQSAKLVCKNCALKINLVFSEAREMKQLKEQVQL
ncbi:hypothetical protein CAPTEDRAFT_223123 [Capitella teleta]|uniref:Uncharacterized protein n=1 Tax=Capitella teleta TaxID=283909 RepID=R7V933_CAPTE|nr:hypothetical protein CAPTEDRAFT_223123 [Capitella teleta]|eukprot:ELU12871.1 hypothetical protein CAPTEDRAFT_223123 [Capitella teleta]